MDIYKYALWICAYVYGQTPRVHEKDSIHNKHLSIAIMFELLSSLVEGRKRIAPALEYFTI